MRTLNNTNKRAIKDFTSNFLFTFLATSIPVQIIIHIDYIDAVLTLFTLAI